MDQGSARLKDEGDRAAETHRLLAEIAAARDELGVYAFELDRRRREALDLNLQLRKHPAVGIGVAAATAVGVAGAIAMVVRARKHATQGPAKRSRLRGLLLRSAIPIAIGAARSLLGRGKARLARFA